MRGENRVRGRGCLLPRHRSCEGHIPTLQVSILPARPSCRRRRTPSESESDAGGYIDRTDPLFAHRDVHVFRVV